MLSTCAPTARLDVEETCETLEIDMIGWNREQLVDRDEGGSLHRGASRI